MNGMKKVRGVFHDRDEVTRAVELLVGKSVPVDEITVTVMDASGAPKREIPVEDEMGTLHGALLGAAFGSGLGFVAAVVAVGLYAGWSELFSGIGLSWALRGALIGVVGGVPLGAILYMGRWRKKEALEAHDLRDGSVVVEVHSDELAELARQTLDEAGAERVTTD